MDLLGSILGAMDKPPARDKKEKEMIESKSRKWGFMKVEKWEKKLRAISNFRAKEGAGDDAQQGTRRAEPVPEVRRREIGSVGEGSGEDVHGVSATGQGAQIGCVSYRGSLKVVLIVDITGMVLNNVIFVSLVNIQTFSRQ